MDAKATTRDTTIYLGTVRAGTQLAMLPNGNLVAIHPEEKPLLITPQGLVPIEAISVDECSPDCTLTMSVGPALT